MQAAAPARTSCASPPGRLRRSTAASGLPRPCARASRPSRPERSWPSPTAYVVTVGIGAGLLAPADCGRRLFVVNYGGDHGIRDDCKPGTTNPLHVVANRALTDSPLWMRRMASARSGASDRTVIWGRCFSGGNGTVLVVTISA